MDLIWDGLAGALAILWQRDPAVVAIILRSLKLSGLATLISLGIGIPFGTFLALSRFPGRRFIISVINTGMALPPVLAGLIVSIMLWRSGPFGAFGLMYTQTAIVIAQIVIATPIVTGISLAAIGQLDQKLQLQMLGLGASRWQLLAVLVREARLPLLAAMMAGFGRLIAEVGAVTMVGGSIKGDTEVMTTAIVLEVAKGHFDVALALGIMLLLIAYVVNLFLTLVQQRGRY